MAKKRNNNKTRAVEEYLQAHPGAMPTETVAALAKKGVTVSRAHVSNIRTRLGIAGGTKKAARKRKPVEAAAPAVAEKPAKPGDAITLEQIKKVAQTVKAMGGFGQMTEVLEVIKEAGGVKKFRELAEAISCPETYDDIPF